VCFITPVPRAGPDIAPIATSGTRPCSGPSNGTARGYFRNEHSNGDIDYGTTESTVTTKGTEVTMTGTWRFTGGTGKFAKITGNGTFTDTQTSPMASEGAWRGSYSLG
jgi:hypothetical protein